MKHAFKPQPDGTTRDLHTVPDDYAPVRGEVVRDGPQPSDKRDTWTEEARARDEAAQVMQRPATLADVERMIQESKG